MNLTSNQGTLFSAHARTRIYIYSARVAAFVLLALIVAGPFAAFGEGGKERRERRRAEIRAAAKDARLGALRSALEDEDADVRASAADALGRLEGSEARSELRKAMKSDDVKIRRAAAHGAARGKDAALAQDVIALLEDPDRIVRWQAVEALAAIGGEAAVVALADTAANDEYVHVRDAAIKALGRIGGEGARTALRRLSRRGEAKLKKRARDVLKGLAGGDGR